MKYYKVAELQGEVLELREENEQLKKQLAIQNGISYGQDTTLHY
jgi:cell shape-determining protein MreC